MFIVFLWFGVFLGAGDEIRTICKFCFHFQKDRNFFISTLCYPLKK